MHVHCMADVHITVLVPYRHPPNPYAKNAALPGSQYADRKNHMWAGVALSASVPQLPTGTFAPKQPVRMGYP